MKKSIIAIVIAAASFSSVSAFAEGGNHSEVIKSVIGEVLNAKQDHENYSRAFNVVVSRLGLSEEKAGQFVAQVFETGTYKELPPTVNYSRAEATPQIVSNNETPVYSGTSERPNSGAQYPMTSGVKNDPTGKPVDVAAVAQQQLTAEKYASANKPLNGIDGKDGAQGVAGKKGASGEAGKSGVNGVNGKDGVTTVITKTVSVVDTETKATVISHSRAINRNSAAIERNSQRIERNTKQIAANTKAIKQVGAMAQATANLHYNVNRSGYAVAAGEYKGATAFAGGVQVQTSANTAITLQASFDGESVGASVGFHGDF